MSSTDRQLLFGVLALQLELITVDQFVEACTIWASKKDRPLPDLLFDRGWLQAQDKSDIDRLLARKLEKHGGDAAASLQEAAKDTRVRQSLLSIGDDDINRTLDPTPPPHGVAVVATRAFEPKSHDRYTLSRLHAQGGIGRVWLAHDVTLRREVALKELRPEKTTNDALLGRFLREARVTGQLEHPGIVPIYEVGERPDDHAPYYTMRFIRGQTLAEAADDYHERRKIGEAGPLELRKLLSAFVGVCNAIAYAHSRGVLHRDLKPQNVVLGGFGEVIVLDWGLARLIDEAEDDFAPLDLGSTLDLEKTRDGQTLGTPPYMAPEQAMGRPDLLSPATDVYGLGAVLYHLLTNRPPFVGPSQEETMRQVISDPPAPPRDLAPDVPPALEAICLKGLSKKPSNRYESATAFADEMQHWLADEPVKAFSDPLYVKAGRWMRRRKAFVAAASVFLVCAAATLGITAVMFYREQKATERNLGRTIALVEDVIKTADAELGRPGVDTMPARRRLIERVVAAMDELLRERPDDPRVQSALASMKQYEGTVLRLQGRSPAAEESLRKSIATLEPLVAAHPNDGNATMLAAAYYQLGELQYRGGLRRDATASHERAILLSEGPAAKGSREAKFNLAVAVNELSVVQFGWQPMDVTEKTAMRAVGLLREVVGDLPVAFSIRERQFLSGALQRIAHCRRETDRAAEAERPAEESLEVIDKALLGAPTQPDTLHFRAWAFVVKGRVLAAIPGREAESLKDFHQAIVLWKAAPGGAGLDRYTIPIASALARRGSVQRRLKQPAEAAADLAEADAMLDRLPPGGRVTTDYFRARVLASGERVRLALETGNAAAARQALAAAHDAYAKLHALDPDNELDRKELEKLDAEAAAAKG